MDVPGTAGSLAIEVGTNHGAIVVGDHNVVTLHVAAPPRLTLRTPAPVHRPRTPDGFLDRRLETGALIAALGTNRVVEVSGAPRVGKSWFLQQAADQAGARFPDGALHLPPGLLGPHDVLQSLFEMFYDAEPPAAPSSTRLRELLGERQALVVVDDSPLSAKDAAAVLDAARGCRLLVAGQPTAASGDAMAIRLAGLPIDDAMALAERVHGGALSDTARTVLLERCQAVGGHPQGVIDAAHALRAEAAVSATAVVASGSERALFDTVRAFAPHAVPQDALASLAGVPDAEPALAALVARGVIRSEAGAVHLAEPAAPEPGGARQRIEGLVRLGEAARANPSLRRRALKALPLLWLALSKAVSANGHADVLALAQAWHVPVTLGGLWDGWHELLARGLDAARSLGDAAALAWLLHQAGTRELALGQVDAAASLFEEALALEQQLGDAVLQAATRHHLDLISTLSAPPLPPDDDPAVDPEPMGWMAKAGLGAALLGLSGAAWVASAPELEWAPARLEFAAASLGGEPPAQQVEFRNRGWRALPPAALALEGSGAPSFASEGACAGRVLRRRESCTVTVRYRPVARGVAEATLTLRAAGSAAVIPLAARVAQAELVLPERLDFGAVDTGGPPAERGVELRNAGDAPARITGFVSPAAPFALVADSCRGRTLAPGQSCSARLAFSAAAPGPAEQRLALQVGDDAAPASPTLRLSGLGRPAALSVEPPSLDFGAQNLEEPSLPRSVRVTNHGAAAVTLGTPRVSPPYAPFRVAVGGCRTATLAPGEHCEFQLTFAPQTGQRGARSAAVRLGVSNGKPLVLPANGIGTAARVALDPTVVDFGNRAWPPSGGAANPTRTVAVRNRGDAPLRMKLRIGGAMVADFPFRQNCPAELLPGERCDIVVGYRPRDAGASDAYLTFDAPGADGDLRLPLLGRAVLPRPAVPVLTLPRDNASVACSGSRWPVEFQWAPPSDMVPGAVQYTLVLEPGVSVNVGAATHHVTEIPCPQVVKWRVVANTVNQAPGASAWRRFQTFQSGSSGGRPSSPGAPSGPTSPTGPSPSPGGTASTTSTVSPSVRGGP